jgi:hypothetical protein
LAKGGDILWAVIRVERHSPQDGLLQLRLNFWIDFY